MSEYPATAGEEGEEETNPLGVRWDLSPILRRNHRNVSPELCLLTSTILPVECSQEAGKKNDVVFLIHDL